MTDFRVLERAFFADLDHAKRQPITAVPTGFPQWDTYCRDEGGGIGLARGWQILIGGKPGIGKSLLATNLTRTALQQGVSVGRIDLEMSNAQSATRLMATVSGIGIRRLEHGAEYEPKDAASAADFFKRAYEATGATIVVTDDISSLEEIEAAVDDLAARGVRYVVVDYLQLVHCDEEGAVAKVANIARRTRLAAKRNGLVVLGVSQITNEAAKRDTAPTQHDLFGGGSLGQSADQVVLLNHCAYERTTRDQAVGELLLDKNRHGAQGTIPITYDYRTLTIRERHDD